MAEIKPAEISAILKQQLSGFESGASLEEVGTVLQVGDGIARVYGLSNAQYGELVQFENGLEAIDLVKKHKFDLILMDIHMPVLNGFDASKKIRELGVLTPIIALTASDKNEIINEMAINGINDVLVKPFEIKDLQIIIEKHV